MILTPKIDKLCNSSPTKNKWVEQDSQDRSNREGRLFSSRNFNDICIYLTLNI